MTIPDFQSLMRPVLAFLADGQVRRSRDITEAMSDQFHLTPEERAEMLPSGTAKKMANRVVWTLTHLTQAGLIDSAGRGLKVISAEGRGALDNHPERVDTRVLEGYPAYVEFRERKRDTTSDDEGGSTQTPPDDDDDSRTQVNYSGFKEGAGTTWYPNVGWWDSFWGREVSDWVADAGFSSLELRRLTDATDSDYCSSACKVTVMELNLR